MADTNLNYYYIKPTLNIPNITLILIIIIFFCYLILKMNYISTNWENEKCNNSNFFLAPLFGKDSETTLQQCTSDIVSKSVNDKLTKMNITKDVKDLNQKFDNLTNTIKNAVKSGGQSANNKVNSAANIISGIQKNIDNIKTALTKVLGTVILSSHMSNGIIQSTKTLENTDLVNIVNQYNNTKTELAKTNANPMPQPP